MATSPHSVEERLAVFEKQTTTIQNSLNDLTILIRSLLLPVPPGNDDNILQMADAPTYATIAAVESEITLDKAELLALTRNPSSSINSHRPIDRGSPPSASLGLPVLPNRALRYDPTPPHLLLLPMPISPVAVVHLDVQISPLVDPLLTRQPRLMPPSSPILITPLPSAKAPIMETSISRRIRPHLHRPDTEKMP